MHIEKNVRDYIIVTMLDIEGKTKDTMKARMDLKDLGYRQELRLDFEYNGRHSTWLFERLEGCPLCHMA